MHGNSKAMDYLWVLRAVQDIPFGVGKALLTDFLQGRAANESIKRNRLDRKESFGSLAYDDSELAGLIDSLIMNRLIAVAQVPGNKFWKVLELTPEGAKELEEPGLYKKKTAFQLSEKATVITDSDKEAFALFGDILKRFNDDQKKAIISNKEHILCLAGAGSGKTTVLTSRVDFLIRYRSAEPSGMLAITFTRKARQEMAERLAQLGHKGTVMVETFNSFCEKILIAHNDLVYDRPVKVISYGEKVRLVEAALESMGYSMHGALGIYFTETQHRLKSESQLMFTLVNDCFFIRDYFKWKNRDISELSRIAASPKHAAIALMVFGVCNYIEGAMRKKGLRDYSDQLIDAVQLFRKVPGVMPRFEHILVDEYQDVNATQIELLDLLNPRNLFCVGDPRQSIFGWRGSDIRYILRFAEKYPDAEIITLTCNYRSTKPIVTLINAAIKSIGLADLVSANAGDHDIHLLQFRSDAEEIAHIIHEIKASKLPRSELFVLARTNKQLAAMSEAMKIAGISHIVKSEDIHSRAAAGPDEVTVATIHAIKGLEAEKVFVMGCTSQNFPCKGSEHPVIELVKVDEYDKEEEERRLFYVAMSRAKKSLHLSYTGSKPTYFISAEMRSLLTQEKPKAAKIAGEASQVSRSSDIMTRLREWRRDLARELNIPPYLILHDKTMIELAQSMPMSSEDLESIHGLGPVKIRRYGDVILDIISGK